MGPVRRSQELTPSLNAPFALNLGSNNMAFRNLSKSQLGGVIFGCKHATFAECLSKQLFGLPFQHFSYVKNIDPGLLLFLFNYSDRKLHGIFEAASSGQLNINPYGWTPDGSQRTSYPAQVLVRVWLQCQPLTEEQFKPVIADSYYSPHHFWFELDHAQANELKCILASLAVAPSRPIPEYTRFSRMIVRNPPSDAKTRSKTSILPALNAGQYGESNLVLGSRDAAPIACRMKEDSEGMLAKKVEDSSHSSWTSEFTDVTSSHDGDDHPSESHSDTNVADQNEKDLILNKLKELTRKLEPDDLLSKGAQDSAFPFNKNIDGRDFVDKQTCFDGKIEKTSCAPLVDPLVVSQLMKEMEELKAFKREQTSKIGYLEQKLVEAETEIKRLKERCIVLESASNHSVEQVDKTMIEYTNAPLLDPTDSILLLGGYNGESLLAGLDAYFPSKDVIKSCRPMSCYRAYASAAQLNGRIYIFGGGDGGSVWYETAESYNPSNGEWTCCPSLNGKKRSLGGATANNKVFAIGGGNGFESLSDVEMLDLDAGRWIQTRSMLEKRFAVAAAELHSVLYAVGGYDGNDYLKSAERFDRREHSWTRIAAMNSRRGCHSLVVLNEKLYAIGGFNGDTMTPSAEMYDPRLGAWMSVESMHHARGYSAAAVLNNSIYVMGGVRPDDSISNNVERFEEGRGWQEIPTTVVGERCFFSALTM